MSETIIRHSCGFKFIKEATLWKTQGKCPKCKVQLEEAKLWGGLQ